MTGRKNVTFLKCQYTYISNKSINNNKKLFALFSFTTIHNQIAINKYKTNKEGLLNERGSERQISLLLLQGNNFRTSKVSF